MSPASTLALALCLLLVIVGCRRGADLHDAERAYAHGDLAQALIAIDAVLEKDALNAEALLLLGRVLVARGDGDAAERELRKAIVLGIRRERIDRPLAQALLLAGHHERLLDEIKPAPHHKGEVLAAVLAARGVAHLALGQLADARASFADALNVQPDFVEALLPEARLAYLEGDLVAASTRVERVIASSPHVPEAWLMKAELLHAQGRMEQAMEAYEEAAGLAPESILPRLAVAQILIATGRLEAAQIHLDRVLRMAPNHPMANYTQALLHFRQKDYPLAQRFVHVTLTLAPKHAPALFLLAAAELAQGAVDQAEERFRRIVEAYPNDLLARKLYTATLLQMNAPARALEVLTPVLPYASSDQELLSLAGEAHMQAKQYALASSYLERAAALRADQPEALVRLGLLRLSGGEPERGIAELQRAAGIAGGDMRADFVLALAHLRRRDFGKALQAAHSLEKKHPYNPIAHNLAGAAHLGMGDRTAARLSFLRAVTLDPDYLPAAINLAVVDAQEGRSGLARERLETVLRKDKSNVDAIVALAKLSDEKDMLISRLEHARERDSNAIGVRLMLARQYMDAGNIQRSLEIAREAVSLAPKDAEALDALGAAQLAAGINADAVATYEQLVAVSPNSAHARYRLAYAYTMNENQKAAVAEYRKVIGLKPDHTVAMTELARLYARLGQFEPAGKLAEELKKRLPESGAGEELHGDLLARQGRYSQAATAYDAAFAIAPSGACAVKYHGALEKTQDSGMAAALQRLEQWVAAHPHDDTTRHYLADQQTKSGSTSAAAENYRLVISRNPNNAFALNNLANLYLAQSDPRALETAEAAYKLRPDHPEIADTLGWLLTQSGQPQRGLPLLRQAAAGSPDSADIRLHLAIAMAKTGDRKGARAVVKKLLDQGKNITLDPETRALLRS